MSAPALRRVPPRLRRVPTGVRSPIDALLNQRLVICLGPGGVGKTSTAAALGVAAALRHRPTAVITVDPAQRLKDTLGLDQLSIQPRAVPLEEVDGCLDALAIDTKRTFDALITRVAPSPEIARRILANRLYQELSSELGGSTEYMAMEKLHDLLHQDAYALVVVDTPPSTHARDLLNAPIRLLDLLASSAVRILKAPASILSGSETGFARLTLRGLLKALERWTGLDLLTDLADFVSNFEHLVEGFHARAADVQEALRRSGTSFVLVTTPEPDTIDATLELHRDLGQEGFPLAGIIINRLHDFAPLHTDAGLACPEALRRKLLVNYADFEALGRRDRRALKRLRRETAAPILASIPALEEPPTSLASLLHFAELLCEASQRSGGGAVDQLS
jgi:anion-transporting  ArsA/GET3 family ATPase